MWVQDFALIYTGGALEQHILSSSTDRVPVRHRYRYFNYHLHFGLAYGRWSCIKDSRGQRHVPCMLGGIRPLEIVRRVACDDILECDGIGPRSWLTWRKNTLAEGISGITAGGSG